MRGLRDRAVEFEGTHAGEIEAIEPHFRNSARNLLHYLSVRQQDIRSLQQDLHSIGCLRSAVLEAQVLATLNAVIGNLEALAGARPSAAPTPPVDFQTGPLLLRDHTRRLLGPMPRHRSVRVMVTMPSEAASNAGLIGGAAARRHGRDAHQLRARRRGRLATHGTPTCGRPRQVVGRKCRIQADLGGPKLRTGPIGPIGHFLRIKPGATRWAG